MIWVPVALASVAAAGVGAALLYRRTPDAEEPFVVKDAVVRNPRGQRVITKNGFLFSSARDLLEHPGKEFSGWSEAQKLAAAHEDLKGAELLRMLRSRGMDHTGLSVSWRSMGTQAQLKAQGSSQVDFSFHNCVDAQGFPEAKALDLFDTRYGWGDNVIGSAKTDGAARFFAMLGICARELGLVWGGSWSKSNKIWAHYDMGWDPVHVQCRPNGQLDEERARCMPLTHGRSRIVKGQGGYLYHQYESGWLQVIGPKGGVEIVSSFAKGAWSAITKEIGPWVDGAAGEAGRPFDLSDPADVELLLGLVFDAAANRPYVYGGGGPNAPFPGGSAGLNKPPKAGWDCSGFTLAVMAVLGRVPWAWSGPRSSTELRKLCTVVPWGQQRPGDLAFYPGHVSVIATRPSEGGDSEVIESGGGRSTTNGDDPKAKVRRLATIRYRPDFLHIGRLPAQPIDAVQLAAINALSALLRGGPPPALDPQSMAELRRRYGAIPAVSSLLGAIS